GIGEHKGEKKGDEQFEISDDRSVDEILAMLKRSNLQAVMSDSIYVG
ncbi:2-iminoacetate synthase ThiH, partial [Campylobacter jejuni]|nr:2-iminoacetate synthase ThiH [Campylobacter jejuni]